MCVSSGCQSRVCLTLTDEMKEGTIDKILAKDDVELAIEFLMGKRKL